MIELTKIVEKAKKSSFYRWLLNFSMDRMIPFNQPHGFAIVEIDDYSIKTKVPYKRRNWNHIRGLHACSLATLSEFTTGFLLVSKLEVKKYRLIMQKLEVSYHYQGKMDAFASFELSEQWLNDQVMRPLREHDAVVVVCEVKIHDSKGNLLTTAFVHWQIKEWSKVKTKVAA